MCILASACPPLRISGVICQAKDQRTRKRPAVLLAEASELELVFAFETTAAAFLRHTPSYLEGCCTKWRSK